MPFIITQSMMVHFMTVSLILWLGCSQLMIKQSFSFFGDANAHHSEWLESVSPTDRHWRDSLDFCNVSTSPTHIAAW